MKSDKVVLIAPDNRYLTHITREGSPSYAKAVELAWRMSEERARYYAQTYQLREMYAYP